MCRTSRFRIPLTLLLAVQFGVQVVTLQAGAEHIHLLGLCQHESTDASCCQHHARVNASCCSSTHNCHCCESQIDEVAQVCRCLGEKPQPVVPLERKSPDRIRLNIQLKSKLLPADRADAGQLSRAISHGFPLVPKAGVKLLLCVCQT